MITDIVNLLSNTFLSMTPLLLAAVGEVIAEKSGVVNIGLEGIFLITALTSTVSTFYTGDPILGLIIGVIIGLLSGGLHGFISVYLRGDQIIAGVGFNSFAYGLSILTLIFLWGDYSSSPSIPKITPWSLRIAGTNLVIPQILIIALITAIASWYILEKTGWGLKLRACGEDPRAAEAMGVNVNKTRFYATTIGGGLAGLGGAYLSIGWLGSFTRTISAGRGFIALADVAFANWNPLIAIIGAFIFGFADASGTYLPIMLQKMTGTQFTAETYLFLTIPYLTTLIAVAAIMKKVKMPRALGKPYIKE
ncbi:MAG: ABC transporter permease [Desulfurococcales archaeon]|nr:ABC transporter permease [Desulfurococcales archaeon]